MRNIVEPIAQRDTTPATFKSAYIPGARIPRVNTKALSALSALSLHATPSQDHVTTLPTAQDSIQQAMSVMHEIGSDRTLQRSLNHARTQYAQANGVSHKDKTQVKSGLAELQTFHKRIQYLQKISEHVQTSGAMDYRFVNRFSALITGHPGAAFSRSSTKMQAYLQDETDRLRAIAKATQLDLPQNLVRKLDDLELHAHQALRSSSLATAIKQIHDSILTSGHIQPGQLSSMNRDLLEIGAFNHDRSNPQAAILSMNLHTRYFSNVVAIAKEQVQAFDMHRSDSRSAYTYTIGDQQHVWQDAFFDDNQAIKHEIQSIEDANEIEYAHVAAENAQPHDHESIASGCETPPHFLDGERLEALHSQPHEDGIKTPTPGSPQIEASDVPVSAQARTSIDSSKALEEMPSLN